MATRKRRKYGSKAKRQSSDIKPLIQLAAIIIFGYLIIALLKHDGGLIAVVLIVALGIAGATFWVKIQKARKRKQVLLSLGASNPMQLSPQQYERFCGLLLEQNGWRVSYTKAKGDQGADVIAEKNGQRMVIQCKQWSSSVGPKAVQEVHAARSFYTAQNAVVVSTAEYTSGAKDLAKSTGVSLLNHKDLQMM